MREKYLFKIGKSIKRRDMLKEGLLIENHHQLIKVLGSSGISEVWLAHNQLADIDEAIKFYNYFDDSILTLFRQELKTIYKLRHPNLLNIIHFDTYENYLYLVFPYCVDGSLASKVGKMNEEEIWQFIDDVARGIAYLHKMQPPIIHQNIKPENILIGNNGHFYISGHEISRKLITTISRTAPPTTVSQTLSDSIPYLSPEQFSETSMVIMASDIWSFGMTLYEVITGEVMWDGMGGCAQLNGAKLPDKVNSLPEPLSSLIKACLEPEPWNRPSASQIAEFARTRDSANVFLKCVRPTLPLAIEPSPTLQSYPQCSVDYSQPRNSPHEQMSSSSPLQTIGKILATPFVLAATGVSATVKGIGKLTQAKKEISYLPAKVKDKGDSVFSSIFAPAEVKRKTRMIIQVYLHLADETEKVQALAQESQKNAKRRDYIPLQCKLKDEDIIDIQINIYGEALLMSDTKHIVWHGSFTKCSFEYYIPDNIDIDNFSCVVLLTINDIPVGEMSFVTNIVDTPKQLNPEIIAHKYNKVFISYSHLDESKVKFLHEGLELGAVPHFFDRRHLKTGDVFPQVIRDYINTADLFILCWSENASKSEYVRKERLQALGRAFPQVQPEKAAKLRIYPISIEPRAELPNDMRDNYHFGEL